MKKSGTIYFNGRCSFNVWAPEKEKMILHLIHPAKEKITMQKDEDGFFNYECDNIRPGQKYFYMPDEKQDYPDPASFYQPDGVHEPSEVIDHDAYQFNDINWRGLPFESLVIYELHVGTFTEEGNFESIIPRLQELAETGINAIELMPVAQFPGNRNWGYDAVFPYAVQNSYGGPNGLKKLVDACHAHGIAVFLDVVYNHLGPEGNYINQFAPYFTNKYHIPWGDAINYDGPYSDGVRDFFSDNILYWFEKYHIDGLRVDAIHMMFDFGAIHFWELANEKVKRMQEKLGRALYLIAENDTNSPRVTQPVAMNGYGFTAQWLDDFHHALYVLLDKEGKKRYIDFGSMQQLMKAFKEGFVHSGEYVQFRKRKHGVSSAGVPGNQFVAFNHNHDQVGNRVGGERLSMLVSFECLKIAAAALLLSPYIPLLFMGEEYGEDKPFFYFTSHGDPGLVKKVQEGRRQEFKDFDADAKFVDPQNEQTFNDSKLQWQKRYGGKYAMLLEWNRQLIAQRRDQPALKNFNKNDIDVQPLEGKGFILNRKDENARQRLQCFFNLSDENLPHRICADSHTYTKLLDSKEQRWMEEKTETGILPETIFKGMHIIIPAYSVAVYST